MTIDRVRGLRLPVALPRIEPVQLNEVGDPVRAVEHRHVPVRVPGNRLNDPDVPGPVAVARSRRDRQEADGVQTRTVVLRGAVANEGHAARLDRLPDVLGAVAGTV